MLLLELLLLFPLSVACVERVFSKVKLIKNFLKCNKRGGGGGGGGLFNEGVVGIFQKSEKHDRKYDRRIRVLLMDF